MKKKTTTGTTLSSARRDELLDILRRRFETYYAARGFRGAVRV